jgi:hypothetical protein
MRLTRDELKNKREEDDTMGIPDFPIAGYAVVIAA